MSGPPWETPAPDRVVVAVSGATGFIGRHLCRHFQERGHSVRALVRDPERRDSPVDAFDRYRCELPDRIDPAGIRGAGIVIHCAYASRARSGREARRIDEDGTDRLLALCREARVPRFVFVSSLSAHPEALSYYGKSKLAIEQRLDPGRDLVIRSGLVLGRDGGLFARLASTLRRTGVVPVFGGGKQPVQTVHVDDLCRALDTAIRRERVGRLVIAEPEGLPLRELFRLVGRKLGRRVLVLPLPASPVLAVLRALEAIGIRPPISSENVLGALALRSQPSATDLGALGIELRSAEESLEDLLSACPDADRKL